VVMTSLPRKTRVSMMTQLFLLTSYVLRHVILSAATFMKREDAIFLTLFRAEGDSQLRWT
jgi:hypothetical protein